MTTNEKILYWLPRVLCIAAILFVGMFSLDVFRPGVPLSDQIIGFLIHNIPSLVLLAFLVIAWKWELIGGILILLAGLATTPFIYTINYHRTHNVLMCLFIVLMISFPFIVVGILFILNHYRRQKAIKK